jgi:hypothetical protein
MSSCKAHESWVLRQSTVRLLIGLLQREECGELNRSGIPRPWRS